VARVDSSFCTFFGAHSSLAMGSIYLNGSEEQKRDDTGFSVEKIQNKIALRVVQNGLITLKECRVSEANRLQDSKSFRDTARVLGMTRYMVGWMSTGCQMGAYEHALAYTQQRLQFGKPIASFQMIQDLVAKMLGNVTACQCLMLRLAAMNDEDKLQDHHASLAKSFCTVRIRETVAWARELFGGKRHRPRLQRRTLLRGCRSSLLLRGHARDAESDRRQGRNGLQRIRVGACILPRSDRPLAVKFSLEAVNKG
jgi:alkylation response protein AidB-like acyl-CoA dehydrogenase